MTTSEFRRISELFKNETFELTYNGVLYATFDEVIDLVQKCTQDEVLRDAVYNLKYYTDMLERVWKKRNEFLKFRASLSSDRDLPPISIERQQSDYDRVSHCISNIRHCKDVLSSIELDLDIDIQSFQVKSKSRVVVYHVEQERGDTLYDIDLSTFNK